jgi:hypothetical protein
MRPVRLAIVLLAVLVASVLAIALRFWISDPIDACLDQGGAWDHELETCAFDYQPARPDDRHP